MASARLCTLWADEDGLTSVEYAMLLMTVSLAGFLAFANAGETVSNVADETSTQLRNVSGLSCDSQ